MRVLWTFVCFSLPYTYTYLDSLCRFTDNYARESDGERGGAGARVTLTYRSHSRTGYSCISA